MLSNFLVAFTCFRLRPRVQCGARVAAKKHGTSACVIGLKPGLVIILAAKNLPCVLCVYVGRHVHILSVMESEHSASRAWRRLELLGRAMPALSYVAVKSEALAEAAMTLACNLGSSCHPQQRMSLSVLAS